MAFELRPYQERCVEKVLHSMQLKGNDLVALPTGAGKSIVVAEIAARLDKEILICQPSREILEQNRNKLAKYTSVYNIGTYSASMNEKTVRKFTFATVGSIYKRPVIFQHIGLVIIDEAHLVNSKNDDSMYMTFLNAIGNPKVIGLTATPYRNVIGYHPSGSGGMIGQTTCKLMTRMKSGAKGKKPPFWSRLIFNINNAELVEQGYLVPLMYDDCSVIQHDEIPVNRSHSDFDLGVWDNKLKVHWGTIFKRLRQAESERKSILVFCSSVQQAKEMSEQMPGSAWVCGETPTKERIGIIEAFKHGGIQTVFNMGVLTTGFDHPELDCITMLRPTKSLSLYYQMAGRGVRIAPGKTFCELIDFSGNVASMGAIETIRLAKENDPKYANPVWQLRTSTGAWHNRPLYEYETRPQGQGRWLTHNQRHHRNARNFLATVEARRREDW